MNPVEQYLPIERLRVAVADALMGSRERTRDHPITFAS